MSHVTDIKMRIRDLDAIETEAGPACGVELRRGQKHAAWWGRYEGDSHDYGEYDPRVLESGCAHVLRIKGTDPRDGSEGPWEVGLVPAKDGDGFAVVYDRFGSAGRQIERAIGPNGDKLRREYAAAVATKNARKKLGPKGYTVMREDLLGGAIRLKVRKR